MRGRDGRRGAHHAARSRAGRARGGGRAEQARRTGLSRGGTSLALLSLLALGCSKFQTARECGEFVAAIKTWQGQALKPASSAARPASSGPVDSRALAERYEDLAQRIDALNLESAELLPRAARYQKLAREAATALREVAAAVERGDGEGARKRRVEFDDIARGEAPLVAEINAACR